MYAFGAGGSGQLGYGGTACRLVATELQGLPHICMVACGSWHSAALTSLHRRVYVWGQVFCSPARGRQSGLRLTWDSYISREKMGNWAPVPSRMRYCRLRYLCGPTEVKLKWHRSPVGRIRPSSSCRCSETQVCKPRPLTENRCMKRASNPRQKRRVAPS